MPSSLFRTLPVEEDEVEEDEMVMDEAAEEVAECSETVLENDDGWNSESEDSPPLASSSSPSSE